MSSTLQSFEREGGGRARAAAALRAGLCSGRLAHAWLLYGPAGAGKRALARAFAAALLCPRGAETGEACGRCHDCRLVAARTHPDLAWLEADPADRGPRVDALREAMAELALAPVSARGRVLVIEQIDRLHPAAANALLKTLEEPPEGTVIALLCERVDRVLATIRSRCRELRLPPAPVATGVRARRLAAAAEQLFAGGDPFDRGAAAWSQLAEIAGEEEGQREPAVLRARTRALALSLLDLLLARVRGCVREAALARAALGPWENAVARIERAAREIEGNAPGELVLGVLAADLESDPALAGEFHRLSQRVQSATP